MVTPGGNWRCLRQTERLLMQLRRRQPQLCQHGAHRRHIGGGPAQVDVAAEQVRRQFLQHGGCETPHPGMSRRGLFQHSLQY
ncbi:hypothetical protein D3C78_1128910 [compost metagenome]